MDLPILDLSHFVRGTKAERRYFVQLLISSLGEHGFFKLINHGFSESTIQELFHRVNSVYLDAGQES